MKKVFPFLLILCLLSACGKEKKAQVQFYTMDTVMTVTVYGEEAEEAARAVQQELVRLDKLWSRTDSQSEVSRINDRAGDGTEVTISPDTAGLLRRALRIMEDSAGTFNPMMAPVMDAWGFSKEEYRVPDGDELAELLPLTMQAPVVVWDDELEQGYARLPTEGQRLDLGGIAKGEAAAAAELTAWKYDIEGGVLDLGGNISVFGSKPDNTAWKVAVKDPQNTQEYLCVLTMKERTCSTSGGYERYFEQDGQTYHHIIDPATGYPADSGLRCVTVVSKNAAWADGYSTAFFVMGAERALEFWKTEEEICGEMDLILVTEEDHVYVTEGLKDGFEAQGKERGYTYEFVQR